MPQKNNITGHMAFPVRMDLLCSKELEIAILQPKCLFEIKQKIKGLFMQK